MKNNLRRHYETIYITAVEIEFSNVTQTVLLSVDDFSNNLFTPVYQENFEKLESRIDAFVKIFNGINKEYNRKIHSPTTTYITDIPEGLHPVMKSMITPSDTIVFDPEKTNKVTDPIVNLLIDSFRQVSK